jgi:hypothetical protein
MGCEHDEGHSPRAVDMMKVSPPVLGRDTFFPHLKSLSAREGDKSPVDYISHAKHIGQNAFPQVKVEVKQLGLGNVLQAL